MPAKTNLFAAALIAVGAVAFAIALSNGKTAPTALIPAFEGVLLLICGLLAMKPAFLKHAMHAAAVIGLLGFLAAAGRMVPKLIQGTLHDPLVIASLTLMILLSGGFVLVCILHFRATRKAREADSSPLAASQRNSGP